MEINFDPVWALAVFLVSVRIGALFVMTPVLAGLRGLVTVRVLLTLSLAALLVSGLGVSPRGVELAPGPIIVAAMAEVMTGAVMAFGVFAAFAAFSLAGKILDVQSGFGMGSVYDPVTSAGAPVFATMLSMVAVVAFFSTDAHHALLRGIAFSLTEAPPGAGFIALRPDAVVRQFGLMFSLGVAVIAPAMIGLLLVEAGLSVVSRVLPQMNVFIVVIPAKIIAGIAIFALSVTALGPVMQRVFASIFTFWEQVLA